MQETESAIFIANSLSHLAAWDVYCLGFSVLPPEVMSKMSMVTQLGEVRDCRVCRRTWETRCLPWPRSLHLVLVG